MVRRVKIRKAAARFARRFCFALFAVTAALSVAPAFAQTQQFTPRDETPEQFPAGAGRDETFYACTACHNFKLIAAQGKAVDTGGYYLPDRTKTSAAMRPSKTLNEALAAL